MKTAISIPDELFKRADLVAAETGKSRSQLYAEALAAYLDETRPDPVTDALNAVYKELDAEPRFGVIAARQAIARGDWEW